MTIKFKTQADIWRYLLESEKNSVVPTASDSKQIFGLRNGLLWHWVEDRPAHLTFVEPTNWQPYIEPECWLETELSNLSSNGPMSVDHYKHGAKNLAHEAIKRIESAIDADRPKSIDDAFCSLQYNRNSARTECLNILKDLIGDSK